MEIERKFLVRNNSWKEGLTEADSSFIQQAYLSAYPDPTVRIRIRDSQAWITIKGEQQGISRAEFEYKIPLKEGVELIRMAVSSTIIKRRYEIKDKGKIWEVDEFLGENEGLVLAELEMKKEDETFDPPSWLGEEVSSDERYKNSSLAEKPYKSWK